MKRAYSMRHGRVVMADVISHQDCADDRVDCEICGERVFKVERRLLGGDSHFFSHYRREDATRDCEARVAARMASEGARLEDGENRGQGLHKRIDALGRILGTQFAPVAKISNGMGVREARERRLDKGKELPAISAVQHSLTAMQFQIVARRQGARVDIRDLITPQIDVDFPDCHKCTSEAALETMQRTRPAPVRRAFVQAMTELVCQATSRRPLHVLARHAFADLVVQGPHWDDPRAATLHDLVRQIARGVRSERLRPKLDEPIPLGAPIPIPMGRPTWGDIVRIASVARMRDVLAEIDPDVAVPPAGMAEAFRPVMVQATEEVYREAEGKAA